MRVLSYPFVETWCRKHQGKERNFMDARGRKIGAKHISHQAVVSQKVRYKDNWFLWASAAVCNA